MINYLFVNEMLNISFMKKKKKIKNYYNNDIYIFHINKIIISYLLKVIKELKIV